MPRSPDFIPLRNRLALRLAASSVLLVALTIAYFGVRLQLRADDQIEARFGELLEHVVATAAPTLDGDVHRGLTTMEDTEGEAFRSIREQLRVVQ